MAEIRIERKGRNVLPWILGLVLLLALLILGAANAARRHSPAPPVHRTGATAADAQWDNIPPQLRQYA